MIQKCFKLYQYEKKKEIKNTKNINTDEELLDYALSVIPTVDST
jgi:hypothetical protein